MTLARTRALTYYLDSMKNRKRPRDTAEMAKLIVDIATEKETNVKPVENDGAVKRGTARAKALSARKRTAIAKTQPPRAGVRKETRSKAGFGMACRSPSLSPAIGRLDYFSSTEPTHTVSSGLPLAVVLDLSSRRVVGWSMRHTLEKSLMMCLGQRWHIETLRPACCNR